MLRRLSRFSLRALLVAVTLFCVLLGHATNWKHQRRIFLAEQQQLATGQGVAYQWDRWQASQRSPQPRPFPEAPRYNLAPLELRLFGERGYHGIVVLIPTPDAELRGSEGSGERAVVHYFTANTQADYAKAVRLFPEASIWPYALVNGAVIELSVFDSQTGKTLARNYRDWR